MTTLIVRLPGESESSRALEAAVASAAETLTLPRAVTAGFVAQCAVHQHAASALVAAGADGSRRHVDEFTLMHLLAHYGDARLVRDVASALPAEQVLAQLRTLGTPSGVTPAALAISRGYPEGAGAIAALAAASMPDPNAAAAATAAAARAFVAAGAAMADAEPTKVASVPLGDNGGWGLSLEAERIPTPHTTTTTPLQLGTAEKEATEEEEEDDDADDDEEEHEGNVWCSLPIEDGTLLDSGTFAQRCMVLSAARLRLLIALVLTS